MVVNNYMGPVVGVSLHLPDNSAPPLDFTAWSGRFENPFISSVTVEMMDKVSNTIQVTISPTYEAWLNFTNNHIEYFGPGSILSVKLGYSGSTGIREFTGRLQTTSASVNDAFISMELEAKGTTYASSKIYDTIIGPSDNVLQHLTQISNERGWDLRFYDPSSGIIDTPDSSDYEDLFVPVGTILYGSIYSIVRRLIETIAGYEFYIDDTDIVIVNPELVGQKKSMITFEYRGRIDIERGVLPLVSFDSSNIQNVYTAGSHVMSSVDFNPDTKSTPEEEVCTRGDSKVRMINNKLFGIPETVDDSDTASEVLGKIRIGRNLAVSHRDPNREALMAAAKREDEQFNGIQAQIETLGNPDMTPRQIISVQGLPDLFNGKYFITKVTHSGGEGGFTTSIECFSYQWSNESSAMLTPSAGETAPPEAEPENNDNDVEYRTPE